MLFKQGVDYIVAPAVGTKGKPKKRYLLTQAAYDRWVLHPSAGKKRRPRAPAPTFVSSAAAAAAPREDEEPLSPSALDEYVCRDDDGEEPLARVRAAPVLMDSPSSSSSSEKAPSSSAGPAAMVTEDEAPAPRPAEENTAAAIEKIVAVINDALKSKEKDPVILDDVWEALGYATKGSAVRAISKALTEGIS